MKRAQTSLEISVILGIMILIVVIFLVVNTELSGVFTTKYSRDKLNVALDDIANGAESVYTQGVGAKKQVFISLPGNIHNSSIENNTLEFLTYSRFKEEHIAVYRILPFNVTGMLPNSSGNYWITLESKEGYVNVS